jgi:predicted XRE-type DNA-binding protein
MKKTTEIEALKAMPDDEIDTSDIQEITNWNNAVVGKFYRPIKKPITIRLDTDVVEWFKSQDGKYQSNINNTLREAMQNDSATRTTKGSIFDDLSVTDKEAENLKIKAQLMQQLIKIIKDTFNTQADAAISLGIEQSRLSDLMGGKIQKFTIDNLINMMNKSGYSVELKTKLAA